MTDKIYEMQALALHLSERPTTTLFNELTQRERCVNDSSKRGDLEILELKDLLEDCKRDRHNRSITMISTPLPYPALSQDSK